MTLYMKTSSSIDRELLILYVFYRENFVVWYSQRLIDGMHGYY
jgi:hypothetical protein